MTVSSEGEAIEDIKRLKARYFRLMDTKQWAAYRQLFADDMIFYFESDDAPAAVCADEFVAHVRSRLATAISVHHGHTPEIELTSADSARGVWAMSDWVDDPDHHRAFQGFGHYHEEYRRGTDGQWRISQLRLSRLRVDDVAPSSGAVSRSTPAPQ